MIKMKKGKEIATEIDILFGNIPTMNNGDLLDLGLYPEKLVECQNKKWVGVDTEVKILQKIYDYLIRKDIPKNRLFLLESHIEELSNEGDVVK